MKTLAMTVYRRDPYLPLWLKYYSQFFDDLLVFNDNLPDDPSLELLELTNHFNFRIEDIRTTLDRPKFIWLTDKTTEWMEFYLHIYDMVMLSGCDEFVVPLKGNLREYMENMTTDFARCTGYDVVQQEGELYLDLETPILQQRTMWAPHPDFNKPLITKIPLKYVEGWHCLKGEQQGKPVGDPDLALVHLKRADRKIHQSRYLNFNFPPDYVIENDVEKMFHSVNNLIKPIPEEWRIRF